MLTKLDEFCGLVDMVRSVTIVVSGGTSLHLADYFCFCWFCINYKEFNDGKLMKLLVDLLRLTRTDRLGETSHTANFH